MVCAPNGSVPRVDPMGFDAALSRRQLLKRGLQSAAALTLPGVLAGCRPGPSQVLAAVEGAFPQAWSQQLPAGWQARWLADPAAVTAMGTIPEAALWSLADGWATALAPQRLQPFGAEALLGRLAPWAAPVSRLFGGESTPAVAFPWAVSPWVLVLRNRADLVARRQEGWELLLDPSLKGQVVLPSSPRVSMALVGPRLARVERLRAQALAYDERHGLNLLLSGDAQALVTPLQRVIPLLRRDPRLAVVLPESGAPLSWQLLLRPAGQPPPPAGWLQQLWSPTLLQSLMLKGWVPPLPRAVLEPVLRSFPAPMAALLLPSDGLLQRCWSLPPLQAQARLDLQTLWDAAAP